MSSFPKKIAVAVSGGVDSLYALVDLRERGAEVFALHGLFLPEGQRGAEYELMLEKLGAACAALGVRLEVMDLSGPFARLVSDEFCRAYLRGHTPNPCAGCNREIKFGLLWERAEALGAGGIATGHYARLAELPGDAGGGMALLAGVDGGKDQSYFLALTPPERLARAVFPSGGLYKADLAEAMAARLRGLGLELPQKGESQDICFVPDGGYRDYLAGYARAHGMDLPGPGPILLPDGQELRIGGKAARHRGLWAYTQGQRHGLGLAWSEPLYVLGKDLGQNALIVGVRADFRPEGCLCGPANFLLEYGAWPELVWAKPRYRQKPRPARHELVQKDGASFLRLAFTDGQAAPPPAPGQIAAVYAPCTENGVLTEPEKAGKQDWRLLGGGVVLDELPSGE